MGPFDGFFCQWFQKIVGEEGYYIGRTRMKTQREKFKSNSLQINKMIITEQQDRQQSRSTPQGKEKRRKHKCAPACWNEEGQKTMLGENNIFK